MTDAILVLDIGSSCTKAVLFSAAGMVLRETEADYAAAVPGGDAAGGRQEQAAEDWWQAAVRAIHGLGVLPPVAAVALTGTMQNMLPLAADGTPLRPAILYSDGRAVGQYERLRPRLEAVGATALTGNAPDPLMTLFKIVWLREHEPGLYARTATILSGAKDYVALRLGGGATTRATTDPTQGTTTGLMDLHGRCWAPALLAVAGLEPRLMPALRPATDIVCRVGPAAAAETGLPQGLPVINGCGDGGAATVGAGVEAAGQAYAYVGTTGWVAKISAADPAAPASPVHTLAHPFGPALIDIAPILTAGDGVVWLREILGGAPLDALTKAAWQRDAAPSDLMFLPYLNGERSPFVDLNLRGAFLQLDRAHGPADLFYAVMEGVAFALRHNLDHLGIGGDGALRLIGGGGRSDLWPQLIADATGLVVELPELPTTLTAFGAFVIAARSIGLPAGPGRFDRRVAPRPDRRPRADRRYARFLEATAMARALAAGPG